MTNYGLDFPRRFMSDQLLEMFTRFHCENFLGVEESKEEGKSSLD